MSSTLLLVLALVAPPGGDPPVDPSDGIVDGGRPEEVAADDPEVRFDLALQHYRVARESFARARLDDSVLRATWLPSWLELARAGSGRSAALALRSRPDGIDTPEVLDLYEQLTAFAGETWLLETEFDVFATLRRDAAQLGRARALGLAERFRERAPNTEQAGAALLLSAQLEEDACSAEPAREQRALDLHREVVQRFPGTRAAQESAQSLWRLDRLRVGRVAPDFVTRDVAGNQMRLSDFGRKIIVVEFYSFSDPGVVARMAHRRALFERHREDRFTLLGINLDADPIAFRRALEEHEVEWPNSFEGGPEVRAIWKVRRGPIHFVLDPDRVVQSVGKSDVELDAAVDELLSEVRAKTIQGSVVGTQERQR